MPEMEWPEFSIPDVGKPEGEPQASGSGVTSGPAPAAAAPKEPAGTPAPSGEAPKPGDDLIPKYRFDEINSRFELTERQLKEAAETNKRLLAMLEAIAPKPAPGEPDPEAERRQRLLNQLLELDPRFAKALAMAEKSDQLEAILQDNTARAAREKEQWDNHAKRTLAVVHDSYAKAFSGGKKTGADLPEDVRQVLTDNFVNWVMRDPTGGRAERYNARDQKLTDEFVTDWKRQFVEPWSRQVVAGQVTQARKVANLPVGGGTSSPLGTPPPKPNDSDDEDAIFKRGWEQTKQAMEQS